jgi:hypothetical protein
MAKPSATPYMTETDCVAGHAGLELRNVVANYPFERSHRFAGIQPNLGHRDYSRAAALGDTQLVLDLSRHLARAVRHRGVLAELPLGSAVNLQHTIGGAVTLEDDIHGAANAVFDEELRGSKPLLILKVIADDGLPGTQGKTRRGLKISPDRCHPDDALVPTDACANKKPILTRQIFQYLAKLCFHALGGQAGGLIQQFEEWPSLQCQDAQFRKNLLLSNPHTQGVRRELAVFQFVRARLDHRLGIDWRAVHSGCSSLEITSL